MNSPSRMQPFSPLCAEVASASLVIFGSSEGSAKDTEALVRAKIERYCEIPSQSYFRITKRKRVDNMVVRDYEIQDCSEGSALLPALIETLDHYAMDSLFICCQGTRYQKLTRSESGDIKTVFVPQSHTPEDKNEIEVSSKTSMTPYQAETRFVELAAKIFFAASIAVLFSLSSYWVVENWIKSGFASEIKDTHWETLIQVNGDPMIAEPPTVDFSVLSDVKNYSSNSKYIKEVAYEKGEWRIREAPIEASQKDSDKSNANGEKKAKTLSEMFIDKTRPENGSGE